MYDYFIIRNHQLTLSEAYYTNILKRDCSFALCGVGFEVLVVAAGDVSH